MTNAQDFLSLLARVLLGAIFIMAGIGKLGDPAGTAAFMETSAFPIPAPGVMAYAVGAFELIGGLAILLGILTRPFALALALFTVAASFGFHSNFADEMQWLLFTKNLGIEAALLLLAANGPGAWSLSRG
jgi:putative oxidoreductase